MMQNTWLDDPRNRKHFYIKHFKETQCAPRHTVGVDHGLGWDYPLFTQWLVTREKACNIFYPLYRLAVKAGHEAKVQPYFDILDNSDYTLNHQTAKAAIALYSYYHHQRLRGYAYQIQEVDDEKLENMKGLVNRMTTFLTAHDIAYVLTGPKRKRGSRASVMLSSDTVWHVTTCLGSTGFPAMYERMEAMIRLIMLRRKRKDRDGQIHNIGIFNPYSNRSWVMDVNTFDPVVYRKLVDKIYPGPSFD